MHTFAVIWWSKSQAPRAGKLEVGAGSVRLSGRQADPLVLALDDVVDAAIARAPASPSGRPTLVVRLRDGSDVFVQSVVGFGVLHELADVLAPPHPQAA